MQKLFALVMIMCLPLSAGASSWKLVDIGSPDSVNYIDVASFKPEKDLVYFWKRTLILNSKDPYRKKYGEKLHSIETYGVNDCRNAIYQPLYSNAIDQSGKVMDFFHHSEHPVPVGAWSNELEIYQFVCSRK